MRVTCALNKALRHLLIFAYHPQALLASCGWPSVQGTADSTEEEEEQVGFRLPGLPAAGSSSSRTRAHKGKPVQGMALIATQALRDGECLLADQSMLAAKQAPCHFFFLASHQTISSASLHILTPCVSHTRTGDEVLLNYRLSPHAARPPWYHSIDPEAEARRWAQMPFRSLLS